MSSGESFHRLQAARSMCRDFSPQSVGDEVLARLVDAALGAPAAGNAQALDLVVLSGAETALYWDTTLPVARRPGFRWPGLLRAPLLIVPYVDPEAYLQRYSEPDKARSGLGADTGAWDVPYWFVDGGAAVMSLLLAAEAEGLGALLFGQFDHESRVRQALGVPEGRRAIGTVAVGHRATGDGGGSSPGAGSTDSVSRSARRGRPSPAVHVRRGRWDRSSMV